MHFSIRQFLFLLFVFGGGVIANAQSTLGSISGTVHDGTDATVAGATVKLHRNESNTDRNVVAGPDGSYTALNLDPGTYSLEVSHAGFAPQTSSNIHLDPRQQLRLDVDLSPAAVNETVQVDASYAGTITTDDASISAALSPRDVLNLPANYRGAGSTSPLNVIQTLPGVQPDSGSYPPTASTSPNPSIKFSIQGGLPSQSETTVDGISAQNQTNNNIQADAFPSAESIAEIRVDGVSNNAEYGQPGEITTITKSGSNQPHGSAFWYFQNRAFDATPYGTNAANKPQKVANDFGGSIGGPVLIPHLYNGRNRTFFFGTYEGLRFPQAVVRQLKVPTVAMKAGNFSGETATLNNPFTGSQYQGAQLPSISASSAAFLPIFPDPNVGPAGESLQTALAARGYNYLDTRRNDIDSNQFDVRGDQTFGQRLSLFARYTFKNINQTQPADLAIPNGTAFARYRIFATAANYSITPHLVDEFRFGFTLEEDGNANSFNGTGLTNAANFQGINRTFPFNGLSHLAFQQLTSAGSRLNSSERSHIFQYVDNLTWQKGTHTIRFGADLRHLGAFTPLSFYPSDNYGNFSFQQSGSYTGQEFADFLIGAPYLSQLDNVTSDNNGTANAYAAYAQDNWKATPNLNLTFGLRYEFHPAFSTNSEVIGNFDPSVAKSGRILYNAGHASQLDPEELANVNACATAGVTNPYADNGSVNGAPCTPVLSNTAAGLPAGLRTSPKLRFEPRFGFAYRPFGNDRTAIRGGVGYYNITTTGALFYALTGTVSSNLRSYYNSVLPGGGLAFSFPKVSPTSNTFVPTPGSVVFYSAIDTNWHDPYSLQTNLSVDHDLGKGFGMRVSYIGLKTWHLIWQPEFNMLPYSKTTIATDQPRSAFPFPNFLSIPDRATSAQASYHSGQAELSHRFAHGFSFNAAYTYAKNLSDNQGSYGSFNAPTFVDEQGGYNATYSYDRHIDYGNVTGTRRHRLLSSGVLELPVGRGKLVGGGMNRLADTAIGGWQISGIFLSQTGPFLTPFIPSGNVDPSGTGSSTIYTSAQRPDRVANGNSSHRSRNGWFNNAAFTCPGSTGFASLQNGACNVGGHDANGNAVAPIGRFGTSTVGDVNGPGTISLSTGLSKSFPLFETVRLRAEGTFTNVLNHTNLADPVLDVTNPAFGTITQSRGSDFGGNRTGQVSMKLEF